MSHDAQIWSYAQPIPLGQKAVLNALAWRADRTSWRAHPGISKISDDAGVDERTCRRNLRWLQANGFIEQQRRHADSGRRKGERLFDEFELNPARNEAGNSASMQLAKMPDNLPDDLSVHETETTGQLGGDNRATCQGVRGNLSAPYKEGTKYRTKNRTKKDSIASESSDFFEEQPPKKNQTARQKKKPPTEVPAIWPTAEDLKWAKSHWLERGRSDLTVTLQGEADNARDHHLSKGTASKDWSATWRTWARNAVKFSRSPAKRQRSAAEAFEDIVNGQRR